MSTFLEGYDAFVRLNGASIGTHHGASYVLSIEDEIKKFIDDTTYLKKQWGNNTVDSIKGFLPEEWHEHTFNINAALEGKAIRAHAFKVREPGNNGSVDIELTMGSGAQLKYRKTAEESARQQAHPEYIGQQRIIPSDQLKDAENIVDTIIKVERVKDPNSERVKYYEDVKKMLTDRLKGDGVESKPLDEKDAKEIAKILKENGYNPAEHGFTTEELISMDYIMSQAFQAGLSATLISVVMKVSPEICGIICKLIKNGEVNIDDFKRIGFAAIQGGVEGFIRGTVAAVITTSCKAGLLGSHLKTVNPSILGAVTAIVMNTIQNACLMSFGKINKHDFANLCAQDLFITACSLGLGVAGGTITTTLLTPAFAVFGYMVGSFVGSVIGSFIYKGMYSCVLSFCVENGSTFFGLVEQNYKLPPEILESIGVKVFEYDKFEPEKIILQKFEVRRFEYCKFEPLKIDVTFLRRGVISVGVIGYI